MASPAYKLYVPPNIFRLVPEPWLIQLNIFTAVTVSLG